MVRRSALIGSIRNEYWQDWARRLLSLTPRESRSFEEYCTSLLRVLEDQPLDHSLIDSGERMILIQLLNNHRTTVALELNLIARQSRESSLPGAFGGLISAVNAAWSFWVALGQAALAVTGIKMEREQQRLEKIGDRLSQDIDRLTQDLWQ